MQPDSPRHTKIVATLGPASGEPAVIERLIEAGVNFFRVNASHGDHEAHAELIQAVRNASAAVATPVGILYDLQGPKIRVGKFDGPPRFVEEGQEFAFAVGREPEKDEFPTDYAMLDRDVKAGEALLIDDGQVGCEVIEVVPGTVRCRALNAGEIAQRKGINLPQSEVTASAITDKDKDDVFFAVEHQVDVIALSFVRKREDVDALRSLLTAAGVGTPIVSKIEKPQALENLDGIIEASWGVMVARGDLGVELPPEDVPMVQKKIISAANKAGRPVITATQMLESMTRNPRPTRAEASDVANAVLDGTDAVMLSGETAMGKYPVRAVSMMRRIVEATEKSVGAIQVKRVNHTVENTPEAVADSGVQVAAQLGAKKIVVFTETGITAIYGSQRRSNAAIVAFTPRIDVRNQMLLVWGVTPYLVDRTSTIDERIREVDDALLRDGIARDGEQLVLLMRSPNMPRGSLNVMLVHTVGTARDQ